jgi:hypothetical protein
LIAGCLISLRERNINGKGRKGDDMKKRYVISALGAGVAGFILGSKQLRNRSTSTEMGSEEDTTLLNAGMPDQVDDLEIDQLENAKMVSEGSQFGVQYYNELKENE